jgi:hypothetical protein
VPIKILGPPAGIFVQPEIPQAGGLHPTQTISIPFRAEAIDRWGGRLTGSSLQWENNGSPLGTGESFTTALPLNGRSLTVHRIQVTATDRAGASDSVWVVMHSYATRGC